MFQERKAVFSLLNSLLCVNPYLDCSGRCLNWDEATVIHVIYVYMMYM